MWSALSWTLVLIKRLKYGISDDERIDAGHGRTYAFPAGTKKNPFLEALSRSGQCRREALPNLRDLSVRENLNSARRSRWESYAPSQIDGKPLPQGSYPPNLHLLMLYIVILPTTKSNEKKTSTRRNAAAEPPPSRFDPKSRSDSIKPR